MCSRCRKWIKSNSYDLCCFELLCLLIPLIYFICLDELSHLQCVVFVKCGVFFLSFSKNTWSVSLFPKSLGRFKVFFVHTGSIVHMSPKGHSVLTIHLWLSMTLSMKERPRPEDFKFGKVAFKRWARICSLLFEPTSRQKDKICSHFF